MSHTDLQTKEKIIRGHEAGYTIKHLSEVFEVHRNTIQNWVRKSKNGESFERNQNPKSGRQSNFSGVNGKKLLKIISNPASKYGFETDFWTTSRIAIVCQKHLKLTTSRMSIHRLLQKHEHSYKKPQQEYLEASKKKQSAWVKKHVSEIKRLVKKEKAILYFMDEASIQLTPVVAKTWGPRGEKKYIKVTGNRGSVSAISALSHRGDLIFNVHKSGKRFNSKDIIQFLDQIIKHHPRKKICVVLDQAPCHKAKSVQSFAEEHKNLTLIYLPPRSPEFNPDEKIWKHLKHHELKSHKAKTADELLKLSRKKMRTMAKDPKKMRGIFKLCEKSYLYPKFE